MLRLFAILLLLSLLACDEIETGGPPSLPSFTVAPLSSGQIGVTWPNGDDDLRDPDQLTYYIWISTGSDIDEVEDRITITGEGQLSYNITSLPNGSRLEPNTSYEVRVRAYDGSSFSDNDSESVTTLNVGEGDFREEILAVKISETPLQLIGGRVFEGSNALGLVYSNRVEWVTREEGTWVEKGETTLSGTVVEAHLVDTQRGTNYDDLFVVTTNALYVLCNDGVEFSACSNNNSVNSAPAAGSLSFDYDETDGFFASFLTANGQPVVAHFASQEFDEVYTPTLTDGIGHFGIGKLDGDTKFDFVMFSNANGLESAKGDDNFVVDNDGILDVDDEDLTDGDETINPSDFEQTFFLADSSGDGEKDALLFMKKTANIASDDDLVELWFYEGGGDNLFREKAPITSYGDLEFDFPVLADYDGDSDLDLLVSQIDSNHIVAYPGTSKAYNSGATNWGVGEDPSLIFVGDLDNDGGPDVAVLVEEAPWHVEVENGETLEQAIVFLFSNTTTTTKK